MQRPVMDPTFLDEEERRKSIAQRKRLLRRAVNACAALVTISASVLLFDPFDHLRRGRLKIDDGPLHVRLFRGLMYRLAFVPVFVALLVCFMVYAGTHPGVSFGETTPASVGLYYDPIRFGTADGVNIDAWFVPALDATRILADRERALTRKQPAVVLVHDFADRRHHMLPLIRPLHDAGYVVLVVALRGSDDRAGFGSTFGLNESQDVRAAVNVLRRRSFIDPNRISLIGVGTGATACLLDASTDPRIRAIVLDNPTLSLDQILTDRLGPRQSWLRHLRPLCGWTFEFAYQVDTSNLDLSRHQKLIASRNILITANLLKTATAVNSASVDQTTKFLNTHSSTTPVAKNE